MILATEVGEEWAEVEGKRSTCRALEWGQELVLVISTLIKGRLIFLRFVIIVREKGTGRECPVKAKAGRGSGETQIKSVGFVSPVAPGVTDVCPFSQVSVDVEVLRGPSDSSAFVSKGFVSLVGSELKVPVNILRDTGALDSFILFSVLPFSQESDTGDVVLVRRIGLEILPVPLHKIVLDCDLVKG